jgi:hypothetical protein
MGRDHLGDIGIDVKIILKRMLMEGCEVVDLIQLAQNKFLVDTCERVNETSGVMKGREFS